MTLIPFPVRYVQHLTLSLLISSTSRTRLSKPNPWSDRPVPPEALGNMLQSLARRRPTLVLLLENIVADILTQLDAEEEETG